MHTIRKVLTKAESFLLKKGVPDARLDAELIISYVLSCQRLELYLDIDRCLNEKDTQSIRSYIVRRGNREPVQYIIGNVFFCDLKLTIRKGVLIPRPETEELIEIIFESFRDKACPARILDLGTGSGAIALSLAKIYPQSHITAVDYSFEAIQLARENALHSNLEQTITFIRTSWLEDIRGCFDLIVSNPPYLTEQEYKCTAKEVHDYEPKTALVAGDDGIAALNLILNEAHLYLAQGGRIFLETGCKHHERLLSIANLIGYIDIQSKTDLSGRDRFFLAQK